LELLLSNVPFLEPDDNEGLGDEDGEMGREASKDMLLAIVGKLAGADVVAYVEGFMEQYPSGDAE
jgi:hypothetical protein